MKLNAQFATHILQAKERITEMKTIRTVTGMMGTLALAAAFAGSASACTPFIGPKAPAGGGGASGKVSIIRIAERQQQINPIVGMWKITFVSKGSTGIPDGTVIDAGYATWHDDGTEIMNSGRAPITGNFCMGVWTQTGNYTYALNHFGLGWDPTGATLVGPANIRENVTLDYSGTAFSGTFTITQYSTQQTILQTVNGTLTAQRITVDTTQ
jgi:hypothetical protein